MELQEEMQKSFKKECGQTATAKKFNSERKKKKPDIKKPHMKWPPSTASSPSSIIPVLLSSHSSCSDLFPMRYMAEERPGTCCDQPVLSFWLPDNCGCSETCNDPGQRDAIIVRCKRKLSYKHWQGFPTGCLMKVLNMWRNGPAVYLKH